MHYTSIYMYNFDTAKSIIPILQMRKPSFYWLKVTQLATVLEYEPSS